MKGSELASNLCEGQVGCLASGYFAAIERCHPRCSSFEPVQTLLACYTSDLARTTPISLSQKLASKILPKRNEHWPISGFLLRFYAQDVCPNIKTNYACVRVFGCQALKKMRTWLSTDTSTPSTPWTSVSSQNLCQGPDNEGVSCCSSLWPCVPVQVFA